MTESRHDTRAWGRSKILRRRLARIPFGKPPSSPELWRRGIEVQIRFCQARGFMSRKRSVDELIENVCGGASTTGGRHVGS